VSVNLYVGESVFVGVPPAAEIYKSFSTANYSFNGELLFQRRIKIFFNGELL